MTERDDEFRLFYFAELGSLRRLAYRLTGNWSEAEELAQEAMVRTYRAWNRIADRDRPELYARAVLMNRHRSLLRRALVEARHAVAGAPQPLSAAVGNEDAIVIWAALQELPTRQRQAVVLRFYEDLPQERIAAVLGCPLGTVKSLLHRGLARLRERLALDADETVGSDA